MPVCVDKPRIALRKRLIESRTIRYFLSIPQQLFEGYFSGIRSKRLYPVQARLTLKKGNVMKNSSSPLTIAALTTAIAVIALIASFSVSAAGTQILDQAAVDFDNTSEISSRESTYDSGNKHSFILKADYYDYAPANYGELEVAEFAAFEVPDNLVVSD